MARIKYVINERRLAYEGALKIFTEKREALLSGIEQAAVEAPTANVVTKPKKAPKAEQDKAADLAAAGLFETVEVPNESSEKQS